MSKFRKANEALASTSARKKSIFLKKTNWKYNSLFLTLLSLSVFVSSNKVRLYSGNSFLESFENWLAYCLSNSNRRNCFKQMCSCCLFSHQEILSGVVVITSKDTVQHQGISLTMEGSVNLQLSAKSVGVFEAFYNSVKVRLTLNNIFSMELFCIFLSFSLVANRWSQHFTV